MSTPGSSSLLSLLLLGSSLVGALGCRGGERAKPNVTRLEPASKEAEPAVPDPLAGMWHAELESPGGDLGFGLSIARTESGYEASVHNGPETLEFSSVSLDGDALVLRIDSYDSQIEATLDGETLRGTWSKVSPGGESSLPFSAAKGQAPRASCEAPDPAGPASAVGSWDLTFSDADGSTYVGRAELEEHRGEASELRGTILTDTGDYRYLAGCYRDGALRLSVFDGAHAFLFHATVAVEDGAPVMCGDFWSRDSYHATFTGAPIPEGGEDRLADPWTAVSLAEANTDRRFRFAFPDLDGNAVSSEDTRFDGKVVIVEIFGSWCPNCNDQAAILSRWHRQYNDTGLEVVGLAYEFTGDATRDAKVLRSYAERNRISYPLLLAGTSGKADAAATLPDLDRVEAYPTTVFIARDGTVRKIYSGYFGPATGRRHMKMIEEHEALIHDLLAERLGPPPPI